MADKLCYHFGQVYCTKASDGLVEVIFIKKYNDCNSTQLNRFLLRNA